MVDSFDTVTAQFLTWLDHKGVRISPKMALVDLRSQGRGRGALATSDFEEDEVIFSIPRSAVLNVRNNLPPPGTSASGGLSAQDINGMPPWLSLTLLLMIESANSKSEWAPYFSILPTNLHSLVFWSPEELADLQASAVLNKISKAGAEQHFHDSIANLGVTGGLQLFHCMASLIMAYAFDIPENQVDEPPPEELEDDVEEETILTMIPLADMLNADADRNNARLMCDSDDLEMRAIKPIMKGEEIFNDYGQLPRSDLLRRYGFVSNNYRKYDVVEISSQSVAELTLSSGLLGSSDFDSRREVAEREDVFEEAYDLTHADEEAEQSCIPDELLALIWICCVDDETFSALQRSEASLPSSRKKMATQFVGGFISQLLKMREDQYATSLEEDEKITSSRIMQYRQAMAVQVRMGEKEILREAMVEAASFQAENKRMRNTQAASAQGTKRSRVDESFNSSRHNKRRN